MTVSPELLWASVRILGDSIDENGIVRGHGTIGTGFVLHVPSESIPNLRHGYLVTAAHVVRDQSNVEIQPTRQDGSLYDPISVPDWQTPQPGLDLAIATMNALPGRSAVLVEPG